MRILKVFCFFMSVMSVAEVVAARDHFDIAWGVIGITVWSLAFYGIHRRVPATWKLGFIWLVIGACAFVSRSLSSAAMPIPRNVDHRIFPAFVVVGTIVVTIYWACWWYKQKSYFSG
jgi:hypothetical protein